MIRLPVEVAQGILNITPSMRGLQGLIDREMRGVNSRRAGQQAGDEYQGGFGSSAKKLTGILAGAFAAVKIGDFAKSAVDQASDLAEVATKMQVVFGDANSEVQKFASQGAKALGLSSLEAQNAAANFGVFGKSAGLAGKDQADFSTGMAKLAVDMASFSNTTPEDAIEALSSGLRGEAEPLRRYGVLLDDASLRQEALSMGLISTTKDALTPQQKVLASHALIMKQTSDAQGDFERTSGGLANQQRILSAQWTDMKGKLGAAFLPAVNGVVTTLNDKLFPAIDSLGAKAADTWAVLAHGQFSETVGVSVDDSPLIHAMKAAHDTYVALAPQFALAWDALTKGFDPTRLAGGENNPLVAGLLKAHDLFAQIGPGLKEAWSVLAHGDFAGGLGFEEDSPFIDSLFKLRDWGLGVFEKLKTTFSNLADTAVLLWPAIESIMSSLLEATADTGMGAFGLFAGLAETLSATLNDWLVPAMDWVAGFMRDNPTLVEAAAAVWGVYQLAVYGAAVATGIASTATAVWTGITKAWSVATTIATGVMRVFNFVMGLNPIAKVVLALTALAAAAVWAYENIDWFRQAVDATWTFIKDATNKLWEGVLKPAFNWLSDNIHVVGDFFVAMWNAAQPVFDFLKDSFDNFLTVVHGVIDVIAGVFTGDWSRVWDGIKGIFTGIWDQIVNYVELAWTLISGIGGKILEWLGSFAGWVWDRISAMATQVVKWGSDFLNWLWNGIKNKAVEVFSWFASLPGWIWEKITALTSTIISYGAQFFSWIWDGIKNTAVSVFQWFADLPNQIWNRIAALGTTIVSYGSTFIGWIKDGIVAGAQGIWDFITGLPKKVLDLLTGLKDTIINLGKSFVGWIVDGVIAVASKIWDAITSALTTGDAGRPTDSQTGANAGGTTPGGIARGGLVARASGGMMEFLGAENQYGRKWVNPAGRISGPGGASSDSIPTWLSDGEYVNRESSVAKFLPTLEALNSGDAQTAAWSLLPHLATGGFAGTKERLNTLGGELAWAEADKKIKQLKEAASSSGVNLAAFNTSQNPASFGWVRAANQVPFSFAGLGTSVAGGTPGLWNALLTALAPSIPGGVKTLGGFENRNNVNNPGVPSFHAYGLAMDVNAPWNANGVSGYGRSGQYVIPSGPAHSLAAQYGMLWGGDFNGTPDPMHFEIHLPPGAIGGATAGTLSAAAAPAAVAGGIFAPLVERWRGTVLQALSMIGQPATLANTVLNQIRTESSGNPNAINLTDINAQRGYPSRGLVQTIPQTFAAYALAPYNKNIVDPLSNILSGIRYAIARYGSITKGMRGVAYAKGGIVPDWLGSSGIDSVPGLLTPGEGVFTKPQTDAIITHAKALEAGFSGQVPQLVVNLDNSDPLQVAVGRMIEEGYENGMADFSFRLATAGAQS